MAIIAFKMEVRNRKNITWEIKFERIQKKTLRYLKSLEFGSEIFEQAATKINSKFYFLTIFADMCNKTLSPK